MPDNLLSWITLPWTLRPDTLLGATLLLILAALLGEVHSRWAAAAVTFDIESSPTRGRLPDRSIHEEIP